jgi:hypothetical protein
VRSPGSAARLAVPWSTQDMILKRMALTGFWLACTAALFLVLDLYT